MLDSVGQGGDAVDESMLVNRIERHAAFLVSDSNLRAVLIENWFAYAPEDFIAQEQSVIVTKRDNEFGTESETHGGNDFNEQIVRRTPSQIFSAKAKAQWHIVDTRIVPKLNGENVQDAIVNRRENCVAEANGRRWKQTIQAPNAEHSRLKSPCLLREAGLREGLHRVGRFAEAQGYHRRHPTDDVVFVNRLRICVQRKKYERNCAELFH